MIKITIYINIKMKKILILLLVASLNMNANNYVPLIYQKVTATCEGNRIEPILNYNAKFMGFEITNTPESKDGIAYYNRISIFDENYNLVCNVSCNSDERFMSFNYVTTDNSGQLIANMYTTYKEYNNQLVFYPYSNSPNPFAIKMNTNTNTYYLYDMLTGINYKIGSFSNVYSILVRWESVDSYTGVNNITTDIVLVTGNMLHVYNVSQNNSSGLSVSKNSENIGVGYAKGILSISGDESILNDASIDIYSLDGKEINKTKLSANRTIKITNESEIVYKIY